MKAHSLLMYFQNELQIIELLMVLDVKLATRTVLGLYYSPLESLVNKLLISGASFYISTGTIII